MIFSSVSFPLKATDEYKSVLVLEQKQNRLFILGLLLRRRSCGFVAAGAAAFLFFFVDHLFARLFTLQKKS